jgi:hypothetical protein
MKEIMLHILLLGSITRGKNAGFGKEMLVDVTR